MSGSKKRKQADGGASSCFRLEEEDEPYNDDCGDGLKAALLKARRDGLCFDVELRCCGTSSHENLKAHRLILASRSDYMKALISSDRFADSSGPVINVSDVSHSAMSHILNWMYGEEMVIPNVPELIEVAEASSRLQCVELTSVLDRKMTEVVTVENSVALWKLADRLHMMKLAQEAQHVAGDNFTELVNEHEPDFLSLNLDMLLELLNREKLNIDGEEELFTTIMKWCKFKKDVNALPENAMEQVLTRVQFSNISRDFYFSKIETELLICDNLSCLRVIARASVERSIDGQTESKKKRRSLISKFHIEDFEVGMRVKVISDLSELQRLCEEGDQRYGAYTYEWNNAKHRIAGNWYEIIAIRNNRVLMLSDGCWLVPAEAIERISEA